MKRLLAVAAAAGFLLTASPVFAQDRHDDHRGGHEMRHAPPPRYVPPRRPPPRRVVYREGQNWRGHRLTNRGGHWGYYQPRNGAQIFINIPL